jgi:hypothetical protein
VDGKEQSNLLLYVVVLLGLVIIGVVKAVFGSVFQIFGTDVDIVSVIVTEILSATLMFGLLVFIIQRVTAPYQSLADKLEVYGSEQDRIRTVQEKILATGVQPAAKVDAPRAAAKAAPAPVAAVVAPPPPPPAPPKDPLEAQLEEVIDEINFEDMFADYQAERDEALARGEGIDDGDGHTEIAD